MNPCVIDHITITAPTLEAGEELVKSSLGVTPQEGGEHPRMGTHNLLLRLGESVFLEVIASNPAAEKPNRPRWFALDKVDENSSAKIKTWVVRSENIRSTFNICSEPLGKIEPMSRGDKNWLITIPEDGSLPVNEGAPALIEWKTQTHPAATLVDYGLSLIELQIHNPESERIEKLLDSINFTGKAKVFKSNESKLVALIKTPDGIRELNT
ncbi:MAG: VOC family protein [Candidatus Sedimenticola sp. 6PFRAG5]